MEHSHIEMCAPIININNTKKEVKS
jgi:hypothetical protein